MVNVRFKVSVNVRVNIEIQNTDNLLPSNLV